jgi:hypothetical protein
MKQTTRAAGSIAAACLLLALAGHVSPAPAQTRINLQHQSREADFRAQPSTKPFATGTTLPAVCSTGEVFFKSDATPGSNLFLCAATNIWAATQSETVVSDGGVAAGFVAARTGAKQLRIGTCSQEAPCVYAFTTTVRSVTEPAMVNLVSGGGSILGYLDRNAGLTVAIPAGLAANCTGCVIVSNVSSFPSDSIPLFRWNATAGNWDMIGIDLRPSLRREVLVAGDNVTLAHNGDHVVISAAASGGSGDAPSEPRQGTGSKIVTSGAVTPSRCAEWDASGTLVSSSGNCNGGVGVSGTGIVKATAGVMTTAPTIGAGEIAAADKQGSGAKLATAGAVTPSRCAEWDASGTLVSSSGNCNGGVGVSGTGIVKAAAGVMTTAPTIGAGEIAAADKQGSGAKLATAGTITPNRCAEFDANGTLVSSSGSCGGGGSSPARPEIIKFQPVVCTHNGGLAPGSNVSFPSSGGATGGSDCSSGYGASAVFSSTGSPTLYISGIVPPDWTPGSGWTFSANWYQIDGGATGTIVRFNVSAACAGGAGEVYNTPAYTAETSIDKATPTVGSTYAISSASGLTLPPSCSPGKIISIRLKRDNTATGNYTGNARVTYGYITY